MSSELTAALEQLIDRYENTGTLAGHSVAWDLRATLDAARAQERLREAARNLVRLWFDIAGVGEKSYAAMHSGEGDEFTEAMWALRAALHPDTASPTPPTTIAPDGN